VFKCCRNDLNRVEVVLAFDLILPSPGKAFGDNSEDAEWRKNVGRKIPGTLSITRFGLLASRMQLNQQNLCEVYGS